MNFINNKYSFLVSQTAHIFAAEIKIRTTEKQYDYRY